MSYNFFNLKNYYVLFLVFKNIKTTFLKFVLKFDLSNVFKILPYLRNV